MASGGRREWATIGREYGGCFTSVFIKRVESTGGEREVSYNGEEREDASGVPLPTLGKNKSGVRGGLLIFITKNSDGPNLTQIRLPNLISH